MRTFNYIPYKPRRNREVNGSEANLLRKYSLSSVKERLLPLVREINIEIGFGSGEFILQTAQATPDEYFLACDLYIPGVMQVVKKISAANIDNIFLYVGDVRQIIIDLPDFLFKNIYLLFPDPWPKKKHYKRRLINSNFLKILERCFRNSFVFASDHPQYAEQALWDIMQNDKLFVKDIVMRSKPFFHTKFEKKALEKNSTIFHYTIGNKLYEQNV